MVEVLDPAAVERDIAAQFEQREGVTVELSCAEEMVLEIAASYSCTGTTAGGQDITLRIKKLVRWLGGEFEFRGPNG